ncbi:type IV toxin-antitoxin system AbiEi family antitoxin domain-containing protein (plasmid) [Methylomarinum sp. Ch1-1]|uniref:Type IV toxin-antitoxin system AbiEi family antitoxin domain-containing protein n=1 Tax=Methylomarinum roseum TaxID=3067653 RepID=A0AAU7P0I0_9GAMM|nr:type IV toxin-antitoxin system AbiEi family antitoxin domain-containing protein [Methylomarinum sp. Ch1-1]MDP4518979.1 type IV toxin-antitoxin system AbiEi family antitoxin domain-containing protein [Methylomarinum sp. Ch1-1]MDP4523377.1 type IV toxin-antitoxin system AbiEi family antitoxin domain-containing protein [Methylomarinum sp. Ch1-1]
MNTKTAIKRLAAWDSQGRYVFTIHDLAKIFPEDRYRTLKDGINRLVREGFLVRACKGIYVNPYAHNQNSFTLEYIAKTLRRGEYSYVSFESALSEYGVISQIPIDRLTVMTTGRKGECKTPFGVIEFIHQNRARNPVL